MPRGTKRIFLLASFMVPTCATAPAEAAGGPDVVDDAFVETPGVCHVESWAAAGLDGAKVGHIDMGCTPRAAQHLELDAGIEHMSGADHYWSIQPGVKYTWLTLPGNFSVGASGTLLLNQRAHLDGLLLALPMSIVRGRYTGINVDLGWQLDRTPIGDRNHLFWGAQASQAVAPHLTLIGELFGTEQGAPTGQGGIRWSPGPERVDLDLRGSVGAERSDDTLTFGVTVRL